MSRIRALPSLELRRQLGDRREPALDLGPVDRPRAHHLSQRLVGTVVVVRDALTGAERLDQARQLHQVRDQREHHAGDAVHRVRVQEYVDVLGWQPEPPLAVVVGRGQQAGRALLLEPLAHQPLVGARPPRQLGRGDRPAVGERPVEPELESQVGGSDVERAQGRAFIRLTKASRSCPM